MTVQPESSPSESNDANLLWTSPRWNRILRLLGLVASLFLFWQAWQQGFASVGAALRSGIYVVAGILVWLPWSRLAGFWWKRMFTVFCVTLFFLVFAQMYEVLANYSRLSPASKRDTGGTLFQVDVDPIAKANKPRPPIDRGVILFLVLLQVPAVLFLRHPRMLK